MNITNIIMIIILSLVLITLVCTIIYKVYNDKLLYINNKITKSNNKINMRLKDKYNILIKSINLIESKIKINSSSFDEVKNISKDNINNFNVEKTFNKAFNEIEDIFNNNDKSKKYKSFKTLIENYYDNELHIISLRTYYNKNVLKYNLLLRKFPYIFIAKIKKYEQKLLFDGLEIDKNN